MSVKAFELVPAIERVNLANDRTRIIVKSIECFGKHLYLGTSESFLVRYLLEEKSSHNGKLSFNCQKQVQKYLGLKKPIQEIKAAPQLGRIIVSCDASLQLLDMFELEPINSALKIKGIGTFCVNENPHSSDTVQICVSRRKQLTVYHLTKEKTVQLKDISVPEPPVAMAMDGVFVCAALTTQYIIVNCETGYIQDLFPYDFQETVPLVRRINKEEFLLNGPNALGMFVTAAGISERPPIQLCDTICAAAYSHPYVLALDMEYVCVYSLLDQQLKQNLQFKGGCCLANYDDKLLLASPTSVYAIVPVPWEKQVQALLADQRISEALDLAQNASRTGLNREQFSKVHQKIQQQAGFIHFSNLQFDEARELFRSGQLDVRELISLYPNLLPTSATFNRTSPSLHNLADVLQMCHNKENQVTACKKFLMEYLEDFRTTRMAQQYKFELDNALLKLYAEFDSPELITLIVASDKSYDMRDSAEWLERFQRYNALGLFYTHHNDNEKALQVWSKIIAEEYKDVSFGGLKFVIEFLANLSDHNLVWKYADFVLDKDQEKGVEIFTERPCNEEVTDKMNPDTIVEYLHRYSKAVLKYLEHIVYIKKLQKEKFHTHLALLYLEDVLGSLKGEANTQEQVEHARQKLQKLLRRSSLYRVQLLLGKIEGTSLHLETAILYGKLEEHEKALDILVHRLKDYAAAESYCIENSEGRDKAYKHRLFQTLLTVYLDPKQQPQRQAELATPAIRLLNSELAEFDAAKVLQLIPQNWSVGVVEGFLCRTLRTALHNKRTKRVEYNLCRGDHIQINFSKYDLVREPVTITEDKTCAACSCPFTDSQFVRFPNGSITHIQCAQSGAFSPSNEKHVTMEPKNHSR